ncbi:MAG: hypothetical protein PUD50_12115, partial [Eubacteriales bacterium]|nr:hypothetical protein [Eubacteriales bacterium]
KEKYPEMIPYSLSYSAGMNSNWFKAVFGMWAEFGVEDGKVVSNFEKHIKEYLTFMSKLYTEGLLDPESAYQTSSQRAEKITAGNVFAWDDGVWSKNFRQDWAETGENYELDFFPCFENIDGTKGMADAFASANMWMFPVTSKHINEVVDIINTFLTDSELETFVNYGVEGEHYTVDEEGTYHTVEGYEAVIYKIYYRLWFKADVWWNNAVLGDFVPEIEKWYNATKGFDNVNLFSYMPTSDAQTEYQSTVDDIRNEYCEKIITGELNVDATDEMLQKMYQNGYAEILASVQDWYDAAGASLAQSLNM